MTTRSTLLVRFPLAYALVLGAMITGCAHAEEYFKSYAVNGRANVQVQARWGSVRVLPASGSKVEFDVTYDKRDWASAAPIESHQQGNLVALRALAEDESGHDSWWGWWGWGRYGSHRLDIEVRMPRDSDLQLQTTNGAIEVSSVNGNISIQTRNGKVNARELSGTISIGSTNGAVELDALKGDMNVRTTNGPITASHLDGRSELSTTNGGVRVEGRFEALTISSTNGGVIARAESGSRMASDWRIHTTNGHVDLSVPADLKANIAVDTNNGRIRLDLPVTTQGYDDRTELRGTLNGGGPELSIGTTNASIRIGAI